MDAHSTLLCVDLPLTPRSDAHARGSAQTASHVPLWLKIDYTAFVAVLVPVYCHYYGPTILLYFCNIALLLTLLAIWSENALLISMCAVGMVVPQGIWVIDFASDAIGFPLTGMTSYMFDASGSLLFRMLSLFHGWLPFLLIYLMRSTGYDRRGFWSWTVLSWMVLLICFFAMPPPTPNPELTPVNINYVWGLSYTAAQAWMPPTVWFGSLMFGLPLFVFAPAHFLMTRFMPKAY